MRKRQQLVQDGANESQNLKTHTHIHTRARARARTHTYVCVSVAIKTSPDVGLLFGVPQGSVLGPKKCCMYAK